MIYMLLPRVVGDPRSIGKTAESAYFRSLRFELIADHLSNKLLAGAALYKQAGSIGFSVRQTILRACPLLLEKAS